VIRAGHRREHLFLISSELWMVRCDLARPYPLEQHDHPPIRVAYLRENSLMIGHVHSLANRSDESVGLRRHRVINPLQGLGPAHASRAAGGGTT